MFEHQPFTAYSQQVLGLWGARPMGLHHGEHLHHARFEHVAPRLHASKKKQIEESNICKKNGYNMLELENLKIDHLEVDTSMVNRLKIIIFHFPCFDYQRVLKGMEWWVNLRKKKKKKKHHCFQLSTGVWCF